MSLVRISGVRPWIGGIQNGFNGVWVDDPQGRLHIVQHSRPDQVRRNRHEVLVYLPATILGTQIQPKASRVFGNNSQPLSVNSPPLQSGNYYIVPAAYFSCNSFLACTGQTQCPYHGLTVKHPSCNFSSIAPRHGRWVTGGWCMCGGRVCLEIRSAAIGNWLNATKQALGNFPSLSIYHLGRSDFLIAT